MSEEQEKKENPESEGSQESSKKDSKEAESAMSAFNKLSQENFPKGTEILTAMGMFGSPMNPLHNKLDSNHITQLLSIAKDHDEREYNLHKADQTNEHKRKTSGARYSFLVFLVIIALVCLILFLFKDQPTVLMPILTGVGGLITGLLGGYGLGKHLGNNSD